MTRQHCLYLAAMVVLCVFALTLGWAFTANLLLPGLREHGGETLAGAPGWGHVTIATAAAAAAVLATTLISWRSIGKRERAEAEAARERERIESRMLESEDLKLRIEEEAASYIRVAEDLAVARDQLQDALCKVEQSQRQYQTLAEFSPVGIWHLATDRKTLYANPAMCRLLGVEELKDLRGKAAETFLAAKSLPVFEAELQAWQQGRASSCEVQIKKPGNDHDLDAVISGAPLLSARGTVESVLATVVDITERKSAEKTIRKMAQTDPLTNLPNRNLFQQRLLDAVHNAARMKTFVGLMFLDLDKFKEVNDTYGHPVGDDLLRKIATILLETVRTTDTVARLGGDEFAIILTHLADVDFVDRLASRIIERVSQPLILPDTLVKTGTSIGICFYPHDGDDPHELIRKADLALYQAKADGRSRYHIFDEAMHSRVEEKKVLENDMRMALVREEFELHYQPLLSLSDAHIAGAEALIRWRHPVRGMVSPGDFITVAESSGLIVPLGEWILRTACRQHREWQNAGLPPLSVSVNISPRQFQSDDLTAVVEAALAEFGLDPGCLELEITEGMMIEDTEKVARKLNNLAGLGVKIAVDDFGTGYSSLAYLKNFSVHRLKIDQSFVRNLVTDSSDAAITETVINLAHSLGLRVTAEGVETEDQLSYLHGKGCDEVQGYYFARPMPADEFARFVQNYDGGSVGPLCSMTAER